MSTHSGPADWWTEGTDAGRKHIANKGIIQNGLVLNLDAGISDSYPGTGTTWFDISGKNLNWSLINNPTYNSSGYFRFNGTTQYAERNGFFQSLDNTNNTFSMWVRIVSTPTANRPIWSDAFGPELGVWIDQNNAVRTYVYGGSNPVTIANNIWFNITFSYFSPVPNGGGTYQHSTYINGELVQADRTGTVGNGLTDMPLNIARDPGQPTFFTNIDVAVWQHYNRRLTEAEIQQNFNVLRNRFGL